MYYFCTYFDKNYLTQGLALWESLEKELPKEFILFVLSLDEYVYKFFQRHHFEGIIPIQLTAIEQKYPELLAVKPQRKNYEYYFTITPTLPWYILETRQEVNMITYVDADIYFFQSPKILFEELADNSIFIVPHFFSEKNKNLEIYGIYNVVFNTFKRDIHGLACLNWWRKSCIEWCFDYIEGDKFADQKYLDKFPILFQKVKICENRGANLAVFNLDNANISKKNNVFFVNNQPLIFYHFHHLRRFHKYFFNPNFLENHIYKNKILVEIYIRYICSMLKFERRYKLPYNDNNRYKSRYLKGKDLLYRLIYNYSIAYFPFYRGVVHLDKYYRKISFLCKKLKLKWHT
ncbi:MAG: hypothetical protein NZ551_02195 [Microscillaceae bacterium]|nr:hypothetical protein [Microscillaceae bacterium]MDW8459996.1 hypothetical protein [Cytophagales bacterium]